MGIEEVLETGMEGVEGWMGRMGVLWEVEGCGIGWIWMCILCSKIENGQYLSFLMSLHSSGLPSSLPFPRACFISIMDYSPAPTPRDFPTASMVPFPYSTKTHMPVTSFRSFHLITSQPSRIPSSLSLPIPIPVIPITAPTNHQHPPTSPNHNPQPSFLHTLDPALSLS